MLISREILLRVSRLNRSAAAAAIYLILSVPRRGLSS